MENAIELKHVTKAFGPVVANADVSLTVKWGEILALLGENGSGKTTLMNILSGIYFPDEGEIYVNGEEVSIRSPKDAFDLGIGMIHQHFKLVDVLTCMENIVLGLPGAQKLNRKKLAAEIREISERYGLEVDPGKKVYDMSVSEKQTVEILKVLYRGANILILDEPTAVLTPQEISRLFEILRKMRDDGKAIIIITHKLNEVMEISDRVTVLRRDASDRSGRVAGTVETASIDIPKLTEMIVGHSVSLAINRSDVAEKEERLKVVNLTCLGGEGNKVLSDVTFDLYSGEILGVAGVAGNGQKELCEAIAGLYPAAGGAILYKNHVNGVEVSENLVGKSPREIIKKGISMAFVPEDRLGMGLVGGLDMVENMMLKTYTDNPGMLVDRKAPAAQAEQLIDRLEIATPGIHTPVRMLSGGNVQKVLLGREIDGAPQILISAYPVRGLDINSTYTIYNLLNEQKEKGVAVLYIGEDLDVLLELCDRILVLCGGQVSGIVDGRTATKEQLGYMMVHVDKEANNNEAK
ncbi:MAG: ABC transporter ATP-binding protein [Clostridiales bacterium]|nr:ABC transporter ATP-binding protein [Clostridiales bacterium]